MPRPLKRKADPQAEDPLAAAWLRYDGIKDRLSAYLVSSEEEFASLIGALDSCWTLADTVQQAAARLTEMTGVDSGSPTAVVRDTMLDGCRVFRGFLDEIGDVSVELSRALEQTRHLLRSAMRLQEDLLPLNYIAFAFRMEGARLSPEDNESLVKVYDEMQTLLKSMKQSGESQQHTLMAVAGRLSGASTSVQHEAACFARRASSSEADILADLDLLTQVPSNLKESRNAAAATGTLISDGIRDAAKALQGHDAIRQQMEHVFASLQDVRKGRGIEAGHALVLQRQQSKHIQQLIAGAGGKIERELKAVIAAAQSIAGSGKKATLDTAEAEAFESAVDRLTGMSTEIAGLLDGEITLGRFIMTQIEPVHALLSSKSQELEALAFSLKMLALNVLITAEQIPGAREVGVLGSWTADAAERVLDLTRSLNGQFSQLGSSLQTRGNSIVALLETVELGKAKLLAVREDGTLRNSRRNAYSEVAALGEEGLALERKTTELLASLTFVERGRSVVEELVILIEHLLLLYPAPKSPLDLAAASAGYAMRDQHEVHASVFGGDAAAKFARLSEPAQGDDYGDNVELF